MKKLPSTLRLSREISITRGSPSPEFAAVNYLSSFLVQRDPGAPPKILPWALSHFKWLAQKDVLGQDIFLVGAPGPLRRQLAMAYCEMAGREVEIVTLTQDTTESDLKQRREIVQRTALFNDQAPVRAAMHGRILILDGLDKAERNVLPTLNNLLENREMALADGRFLTNRSDALEKGDHNLVHVHPQFRVIALGVPVPRFAGFPLDPPLRSRFQVRAIDKVYPEQRTYAMETQHPGESALIQRAVQLDVTLDSLGCGGGGKSGGNGGGGDSGGGGSGGGGGKVAGESLPLAGQKVLYFPLTASENIVRASAMFASESPHHILKSVYPSSLFNLESTGGETGYAQHAVLNAALDRFGFGPNNGHSLSQYKVARVVAAAASSGSSQHHLSDAPMACISFKYIGAPPPTTTTTDASPTTPTGAETALFHDDPAASAPTTTTATTPSTDELLEVWAPAGSNIHQPNAAPPRLMQPGPNDEYDRVLAGMMRSHVLGKDICLVGGKGSGKTIVGAFLYCCAC